MGATAVIGRDHECSVVAEHARPDRAGGHPSLLLVGEAGIGKSVLWSYGVTAAEDQGWHVLSTAPVAAERDLSFAALGDLLTGLLDDPDLVVAPPQRRALEVALLLREADGAAVDQRAVALGVTAVLSALAEREPVFVAIDDVQWVDAASTAALGFALRRLAGDRLRVLATARVAEQERPSGGWPVEPARTLALQGLSAGATGHLIAERLDLRLGHVQLRRVHDAARGNPMHALELARSQGAVLGAGAFETFDPGVELSDLVLKRLSRVPDSTREVLLLAAVSRQPSTGMLAGALERSVEPDLARAATSELVHVVGDRVLFRHPLYAAACASFAGRTACRLAHRRLAAVVADGEARARHLALAAEAPDAAVAAVLEEAALDARVRGAPVAAAELAALAQRLTPDDDAAERVRRGIASARYLAEAGDTLAAEAVLAELLASVRGRSERCRILLALSDLSYESTGVLAARRHALSALDEARGDPVLTAEAQLGYAARSQLGVSERRELSSAALETLRSLPEPDAALLAQALREVALADYHLGNGMSRDLMREAMRLEEALRMRPPVAWRASTMLGECLKYVDAFDEANALLTEAAEQAHLQGDLASLAEIAGHRAELALWLGDWEQAASLAASAVASAREIEQDGRLAMALRYDALVANYRGDEHRARAAAADALATARRSDDDWVIMLVAADLAMLDLSLGDVRAARTGLAEVDRAASAELLSEPRQWRYLGDHVEALVACGDLPSAVDRLCRLREWAARAGGWAEALAVRASAQVRLGSGDAEGVADLARAVDLFGALPLPFEQARTRLQLGAALRRTGQRRAARSNLDAAEATFAELGAAAWQARCTEERRRIGGRPVVEDRLTASEEAVATMVATGASNKEVASALSISPRTVEVHLGRIYRKLGVRNRAELAARYR